MKIREIGKVLPYILEGYLIIALDQKWTQVFSGIPKFSVILDPKGRLNIQSPVPMQEQKTEFSLYSRTNNSTINGK